MDTYNNMQNSNYGVRIATFSKVWKEFYSFGKPIFKKISDIYS